MARTRLAACSGLACLLLLSACAPTLPHGKARAPNRDLPASYGTSSDTTNSARLKSSDFFNDPKLQALINEALKKNQELQIVSLEIDLSQYEIIARRGELYPKLGAQVGVGIEKVGTFTSQGAADEANGVAANLPSFGFGLSASWEIDIWGKLRNATKAARARYLASQEGRNFAVSMLVGEIASSYYELMALDAALAVLQQNIAIQTDALRIVRLQKEAATVTELAVKRFEAEVLKNQSRIYGIQQQIVEAENRINFLVGRLPQHVDRNSQDFINLVPELVHEGVPSQLLENRPDVRQAELQLLATEFDTKSAKAAFYPTLGLSGMIGYQSFDFLKIVSTPASLVYGIAADIFAPLLNRTALTATYFSAGARNWQAVWNYERAILKGFVEVANQLAMIQNLQKSYELRAQQVDKLMKSIDISSTLFNAARADYMEVLLTRRDALDAQMELIETKKQQLNAAVALYQALGGGWR